LPRIITKNNYFPVRIPLGIPMDSRLIQLKDQCILIFVAGV